MCGDPLPPTGQAAAEAAQQGSQPRGKKLLKYGLLLPAVAATSLYLALQAFALWREWRALRAELDTAVSTTIVGYPNIFWRPSLVRVPPDWYHVEGDALDLWAGWDQGVGQHWFHLKPGDLDRAKIAGPMGRDVIHAIDRPWTETSGGKIWQRIPDQAAVIGLTLEGMPCVYPLVVIRKVVAVNDVINDHPYLVLLDVSEPAERSVAIFDSSLDGQRVTLGTSGYSLAGKVLMYDRESESLWVQDGNALRAIAGKRKGDEMHLVARPTPVTWSRWKARNPDSRLVIGEKDAGMD
jgi:hypothetical protein